METMLLKPTNEAIYKACEIIKNGGIVGIPTETVYGLAGDASNPTAIKKIFEAKGRPQDNPLIVHISDMQMLNSVVGFVPKSAIMLAKVFWPGPLTMILPKSNNICAETSAGLNSVGVRMPSNEIARKIISISGIPFAAPSANISGKPSPTTAEDVFLDMNGKIPLIIDGGECEAGIESTVISLLTDTATILRPGIITKEEISSVLKQEVVVAEAVTKGITTNSIVLSPGMKYKHYAPKAEVVILKGSLNNFIKYINQNNCPDTYIMCFDGEEKYFSNPTICYGDINNPKEQAKKLFTSLRMLDKLNAKKVFVRSPDTSGVALAVYNRLIRSAGFNIIDIN